MHVDYGAHDFQPIKWDIYRVYANRTHDPITARKYNYNLIFVQARLSENILTTKYSQFTVHDQWAFIRNSECHMATTYVDCIPRSRV